MTSHEEIQQQIPAYAAARLEPEAARRLEEHLAGCDSCRETAETALEIAAGIREGGEALFEPHPREREIRDCAAGTLPAGERARIERHLLYCASCRLELEAWKSRALSPMAVRESRGKSGPARDAGAWERPRWPALSLAAAAGVVAGALLVLSVRALTGPPAPGGFPGRSAPGPLVTRETDSRLYVLPPMMRGGEESPLPRWTLKKDDSRLSIGVEVTLPAEVADDANYRLAMLREDGSTFWSIDLTAGRMREHLQPPAGILHVTLPTAGLTPGSYEFRITPVSVSPAPPIYVSRIDIAISR